MCLLKGNSARGFESSDLNSPLFDSITSQHIHQLLFAYWARREKDPRTHKKVQFEF